MAGAETAKMVASLDLKDNLSKGLQTAGKNVDGFSRKLASSRAVAVGVGVGLERLAEKGLSALGGAIGDGIQGALQLEKAQAQTQAVITSTGNAAGVSAQQVRDLANSLEDVTTVDDKTIQQGENLLLTFTKIGGSIFPEAAKAATNMAIAFNKGDAATADIDGAAIQLGKALNDPAAGFAALKKSGVSFSEAQIKILKGTNALTKEEVHHYVQLRKTDKAAAERYKAGVLQNRLLASQKLILGELNTEFGKAGEAAGTGFAADISRANDAIDDAKISLAQGLLPAVGEVARELSTTFKDPAVMSSLKDFGKNIGEGIKGAVAFAKSIPWDKVGQGLSIAADAAKAVVGAFTSLPPWVQAAVISGWGLNKITGGAVTSVITGLAETIGKNLLQSLGLMTVTAGTVIVNGGIGAPGNPVGTVEDVATKGGLLALIGTVGVIAAAAAGSAYAFSQLHSGAGSTGAFTPTVGAAFDTQPVTSDAFSGIDWGTIARDLDHSATTLEASAHARDTETSQAIDALKAALVAPNILNTGAQRDAETSAAIATAVQTSLSTVADGILAAGAQRDKETSDAISVLATTTDVTNLQGAVTQGILGNLVPAVDIGAHNTSLAATQAGQAAARQTFASGIGIEGAIRASQPITNVKVNISATNVTSVQVVADRGGDRNSSRDGDGGGGPGQ